MRTIEPGSRNVRGESSKLRDGVCLNHFATKRSAELFQRLRIAHSFLESEPHTWCQNNDYLDGRARIRNLRVTNDTAERGVKLFEDFVNIITKNEEEKQFLLQVVESQRDAIPTEVTKKSVVAALSDKA